MSTPMDTAIAMARSRSISGQLRDRLSLEVPIDADDGYGGLTRSFQTLTKLWGMIVPFQVRTGRGPDQDGQVISQLVIMRWRADVDVGMRLRKGSRLLRIVQVADADGRRMRMVCLCEEDD